MVENLLEKGPLGTAWVRVKNKHANSSKDDMKKLFLAMIYVAEELDL
jgi:hypothetical protein